MSALTINDYAWAIAVCDIKISEYHRTLDQLGSYATPTHRANIADWIRELQQHQCRFREALQEAINEVMFNHPPAPARSADAVRP